MSVAVQLGIVFILFSVLLSRPSSRGLYSRFKRVGNPWILPKLLGSSASQLIGRGYSQISKPLHEPFTMKWWAQDYLIMPPKYLPDLGHMEAENASFLKNFSDAVNLHHSVGRLYESDRMGDIIRKGLNPVLSNIMPKMAEELDYALNKEVGDCPLWTSVTATEFFIRLSHRVVSRFIAGEALCRNEEFIERSLKFSDSMMLSGLLIAQLPLGILRQPVGWLIMRYHSWLLNRAVTVTEPVVYRRMVEASIRRTAPDYEDSITWAIRLNNDSLDRDARVVTLELLHLLEAASGAPGAFITEAIFQLLLDKELQEMIRNEAEAGTQSSGISDDPGRNKPLLDSFLMEVNRLYGVGGITAARTVTGKPVTLHDGLVLPPLARFGFPSKAIHLDSSNYSDPKSFDATRFMRLNASAQTQGATSGPDRFLSSKTSVTYLPWGYGTHACPGRFYAIRFAKLVLITLLTRYEIAWEEHALRDSKPKERPKGFEIEGQFLPNLSQKIKLRQR